MSLQYTLISMLIFPGYPSRQDLFLTVLSVVSIGAINEYLNKQKKHVLYNMAISLVIFGNIVLIAANFGVEFSPLFGANKDGEKGQSFHFISFVVTELIYTIMLTFINGPLKV